MSRYRLLLTVAAAVAAADLLSKAIVAALSPRMPIRLPGGWVLQVVHNNGVIGGYAAGTGLAAVFAAVAAVQFVALLWLTRRQDGLLWAVALGLVLGGGGANVAEDRLSGHVVDWIRPPRVPVTFDLADVSIVIGQVLLLALTVFGARAARLRARPVVTR